MEIFFTKDKRKSTDFAKLFGGVAALALVLQIVMPGFLIPGTLSASSHTSLTVNKVVVGGPNDAGDFDLFVDGVPVTNGLATTTFATGTHQVTENNLPGYTATFSGDCNVDGEVVLEEGVPATCTITNTFATATPATTTSLMVTKVVVGGTASTSDFNLYVDGMPITSGIASTTIATGTHQVSEDNLPGYVATFGGDCNLDGEVTIGEGDDANCIITNTFATSTATTTATTTTLVVNKVVVGGSATTSDFELFVNGMPITSGVATTTMATGTYSITENSRSGYTATYSGDCNSVGQVTLVAGATSTCTITNTFSSSSGGGGGGGGGGQTNRGIERAAAVTPPGTAIAGQGLGLNTFQTFFLPPGQVLGAQSQFRGQVLGAQSAIPGMPSTGAEPLDSLKMFLGVMVLAGVVIMSYPHVARMFSRKN